MYEERLGGEFSTLNFQALKAKACTVGSGASGVMRMWNAAWVQCQDVRQHLEEIKKGVDKNQIQQNTAANPQEEDGGKEKKEEQSEVGGDRCSATQQLTSHNDAVKVTESETGSNSGPSANQHSHPDQIGSKKAESEELKSPEASSKNDTTHIFKSSSSHSESKWRPRGHHSQADLRSISSVKGDDGFPSHQPLGRSLSEGSYTSSHLISISAFPPLNVRHKHCQNKMQPLEQSLQPVQNMPISHNESLQTGNLSCESRRDSNEEEGERCTASTQSLNDLKAPETLHTPMENNGSNVL